MPHRILSETAVSFIFVSELVKKALQVPKIVLTPLTEENSSALGKLMRGSSGGASWQ